ncbi:MAG TPA: hypothetical protein V6C96_05095, partial [Vampirovibrionales bacterium]
MSTELKNAEEFESALNNWVDQEKKAVDLSNTLGQLLYNRSIELVLFRNHLVDRSVSELLKMHKNAQNFTNKSVSIYDTAELAKEIISMDLAPSKIDIGKLASEWDQEKSNYNSKKEFINDHLKDLIGVEKRTLEPKDVILYGFGRIGRIAARELVKQAGKGQQLRLKAIVTRGDDKVAM